MPRLLRSVSTCLLIFLLFGIGAAQTTSTTQTRSEPQSPTVTATAAAERVRYASLGEVHETRLQVFAKDGTQVYDSSFKLGNLIEWQLSDQAGARLTDGRYLYLVTAKDFNGRLTQRYGQAVVEGNDVTLAREEATELPQAMSAALEANRVSDSLSPVERVGAVGPDDGASAIDMPAKGVKERNAAGGTGGTNATGAGTQNFIAKWGDNAGTLIDSALFDNAAGRIGLGTTNPGARFHVVGTQGVSGASTFQLDTNLTFNVFTGVYPAFEVINANQTNNNVSLFQFADAPSGASHAGIGSVNTNHTTKTGDLFFYTKGADGYQARMGIYGGNVGIGNSTPSTLLDVSGAATFRGTTLPANAPAGQGRIVFNSATNTFQVSQNGGGYTNLVGGGGGSSAIGPPYQWVCTPAFYSTAVNAFLTVFNASASTANVSVNFLSANGTNLSGTVDIPGQPAGTKYPGNITGNTTAIAAANTLSFAYPTPSTNNSNASLSIRVTSDQVIVVGQEFQSANIFTQTCNQVHP